MADSTITDISKDMEAQDDHGDITLDSDEIDSDGVLDDDDKSHHDILDDTVDEDLTLEDTKPSKVVKTLKGLKRKITLDESVKDSKSEVIKQTAPKKLVLHRSISSTVNKETVAVEKTAETQTEKSDSKVVKITQDMDAKTRLEMRAKRFGLPIKLSDDQKKEARKNRFGDKPSKISSTDDSAVPQDLDKLKKRADRFGTSVSKAMIDIDNAIKLEKRKAKFATAK